ncbi:lytic transglycosylase domain-containing protein [Luteipulveratus halotolerans]|uniref:lytic transglycosylase domain-containing protein n=1 Tax=Luteipulveratus halotolerans TaxID=1631356 RepID=UPI000681416F|nr:lytic transglycosylase domain-containing protein [Luteipulveratus halotolerans]
MAPFDYTPPANPHALHSPAELNQGRTWVRYTVRPGDSLAKLAVQHRTTVAALVHANRITNPRALTAGKVLQVPAGTAPARSTAPAPRKQSPAPARRATAAKTPARQMRTHVVQPGDNLITLGIRYGVGWSALMKANGMSDPNQLQTGRVLRVPVSPGTAAPTQATPPRRTPAASRSVAPAAVTPRTHTVRPGENLIGLGTRYGVGWRALMNANGMSDPNRVAVGTVLRIPAKGAPVASPATPPAARKPTSATPVSHTPAAPRPKTPVRITPRIHTVRSGENLIELGRRYGVGWRNLMNANGLTDPNRVAVGTVLRIPAPGTTVAPAKPAAKKPAARPAAKKPAAKPSAHKPAAKKPSAKKPARTTSRSSSNTFLGRTYPDHVVASAAKNREALRHVAVPTRSQTRDLIVQTARRYGVNPKLALAIGWQESGWNQRSVSVANAVGIMQVMPSTGQWCGDMVGRRLNLMDPRDNVTAGVVMLRWLTTHASSRDQAIAGYYQGLGGVRENGMYPDTRAYVRNVKAHMARF